MAKSEKTSGDGKMTVMIFQLEGSNATLQEGFHTISQALNGLLDHRVKTKLLATTAGSGQRTVVPDPNLIDTGETSTEEEEAQAAPNVSTRVRKVKSPNIIDIDLLSGTPALKEFLLPHDSAGIYRKYLMSAYWLKRYRQIDEVKADHIHTCFRHMTWATPKDASQPLRDMKSSRKYQWFNKGKEKGLYAINHVGENMAESILKDDVK